jgi:hypothetical protein
LTPAAIEDALEFRPITEVGVDLFVVVPSPKFPLPFAPQHFTAPELKIAHEWLLPESISIIPEESPETETGVVLLPPPLPSAPFVPSPQHLTPPESKMAHVCDDPGAINRTPELNPETFTGTELLVVDPLPS